MLRKDILFGSVVLLLAALFALTGCSQATDSDSGTTVYSENHLFGTANSADVARAVASAKSSGRSVVLTDQLVIVGNVAGLPAVADFGDLPVRVEGRVTVNGANAVIVNAAHANMSFAEDARITIEAGGAFIYSGDGEHIYTAAGAGATAFKVKLVSNPLEGAQGTDVHIAVENYKLGNYSDIAPHVTTLYVLDKITVDAASLAPSSATPARNIFALGTVDLTESNSAAFTNLAANFRFTADSTLTSSAPGVNIGVPEGAILPTVKAAIPIAITAPAATTALTVNKIEGPETVSISAATSIGTLTITNSAADGKLAVTTGTLGTAVNIANAAGNVNAGSVSLTAPTAFTGAVNIGFVPAPGVSAPVGTNTGSITITTAATISTGAVAIASNSGDITLNAPTSITSAVTITNNAAGGTIDFATATASGITVAANTGEIKFSKDFTSSAANFLKAPVNNGVIRFLGTFDTDTTVFGDTAGNVEANRVAGSGKVIFGDAVDIGAAVAIGCDVEFNGGLERTAAAVITLGGNVTLAPGQAIELTTGNDVITLGANKRLFVGDNPVLAAGNGLLTLTPVATATLTAGEEDPDDPDSLDYKTLHLGPSNSDFKMKIGVNFYRKRQF